LKGFAVLVSNCAGRQELKAEHGLSLFIRYGENDYLFDTGGSDLFIENSQFMNLGIENIKCAVLSHFHLDHIGGIPFLSRHFSMISGICDVYHPAFSEILKFPALRSNTVRESQKIDDECALVLSNAVKDDENFNEISMVAGNTLFTGCGHSGILNILKEAQNFSTVTTIAGGFHNFDMQKDKMKKTASDLFLLGIKRVILLHCSSVNSIRFFEDAGIECIFGSVGNSFNIE